MPHPDKAATKNNIKKAQTNLNVTVFVTERQMRKKKVGLIKK